MTTESHPTPTFEQQMQRLETILEKLSQESPLEESIKLFEEASKLLSQCQHSLKDAEARIEKLVVKKEMDGSVTYDSEPLSL